MRLAWWPSFNLGQGSQEATVRTSSNPPLGLLETLSAYPFSICREREREREFKRHSLLLTFLFTSVFSGFCVTGLLDSVSKDPHTSAVNISPREIGRFDTPILPELQQLSRHIRRAPRPVGLLRRLRRVVLSISPFERLGQCLDLERGSPMMWDTFRAWFCGACKIHTRLDFFSPECDNGRRFRTRSQNARSSAVAVSRNRRKFGDLNRRSSPKPVGTLWKVLFRSRQRARCLSRKSNPTGKSQRSLFSLSLSLFLDSDAVGTLVFRKTHSVRTSKGESKQTPLLSFQATPLEEQLLIGETALRAIVPETERNGTTLGGRVTAIHHKDRVRAAFSRAPQGVRETRGKTQLTKSSTDVFCGLEVPFTASLSCDLKLRFPNLGPISLKSTWNSTRGSGRRQSARGCRCVSCTRTPPRPNCLEKRSNKCHTK